MSDKLDKISAFQNSLKKRHQHRRLINVKLLLFGLPYFFTWLFEFLVSRLIGFLFLLFATLPLLAAVIIRKLATGKAMFQTQEIFGKSGSQLTIKYFNFEKYYLRNALLFWYMMKNQLDLVGVSIKRYSDENRVMGDSFLYTNKPGIFNLYYVRESSRTAHEGRDVIDLEYVYRKNLVSDLVLILKSIPAMFYYIDAKDYSATGNLFGINFMNIKMSRAIEIMESRIKDRDRERVFFINPDCLNKIFSDIEYLDILRDTNLVFPDGIGINIACKIIGNPLIENINGTDMLPYLCEMCGKNDFSMYLLGAKPGIADKMRENLELKYPDLKIVGVRDGYFDHEKESDAVVAQINQANPDILLVAFGVPRQEKWITEHFGKLECPICMGVGGLFDFYSGNIPRAPRWMRDIGLEWVYRLMQEPGRMWRRYILGNPLFIFRVLRWKIRELQVKE